MRAHLLFTTVLFTVCGLALLVAAIVAGPLARRAASDVASDPDENAAVAAALVAWTGHTIAVGAAVLAAPALLCAWGLHRHKGWARWLGILLAAVAVVFVPVGTIVGGYVLWVLLSRRFEPWFDDPAQA